MPNTLLFLLRDSSNRSIYKCGNVHYVVNDMESKIEAKHELSMEEAWKLNGTYIYTAEVIAEPDQFLVQYGIFLNSTNEAHFLWLENPNQANDIWRYHAIYCTVEKGERMVAKTAGFAYSDYSVIFRPGISIEYKEEEFIFNDKKRLSLPVVFRAANVLFKPNENSIFMDRTGIIKFSVSAEAQKHMFREIGAGIKYSFLLPEELKDTESALENGFVGSLYNEVLNWGQSLILDCRFDFSSPMDYERTGLFLETNQTTESNFTSVVGKKVYLKTGEQTRLVFQQCPLYTYQDSKTDKRKVKNKYYLSLAGSFELIFTPDSGDKHLLCGLSGLEFADLSMESGSTIRFVPGQNAFLDIDLEDGEKLTGESSTSWIKFCNRTLYYSQPESMPLFTLNPSDDLTLFSMPLVLADADSPAVPMMIYKNLELNSPENIDYRQMEKCIYEKRFHSFERMLFPKTFRGVETAAVTPQGILAGITKGPDGLADWNWVALGNKMSGAQEPENAYIRLIGLDNTIKTELQNDSLSMLFQKPEDITSHVQALQNASVGFAGIEFDFHTNHWFKEEASKDKRTVMIIKFNEKESIAETYHDLDVLKTSIAQCFNEKKELREDYTAFYQTIHDKYFQGIIILNCKIYPDENAPDFIKELKFVFDSIEEKEKLFAHHIIIERNKTKNCDSGIYLERSSVSLLVDYKSDKKISYSRDDDIVNYSFLTLEFNFAVRDSEVKSIKTVSELMINEMFKAKAKKSGEGGNCLIIDGALKKINEMTIFQYYLRKDEQYEMSSKVLEQTVITGVSLACGENGTGIFSLSGYLHFMNQNIGDLFSYGLDGEDMQYGLLFENLKIIMPEKEEMSMYYSDIILNQNNSIPRNTSFAANFPVELERLIYVDSAESPEEEGYFSITSPISQTKINKPWFGLVWRIPLGSLGDLSESSSLDMRLITAWSNTEGGEGLYIGVKLPVNPKATMKKVGIEFQGLLKMEFNSVVLLAEEETEGEQTKVRYLFRFHDFSIKLLSISFPPGTNDIYIFADESGKKLGWYAAYKGGS